jgi:hypothetical protein
MKSDYLKYWKVISQYTKVKYKISQSDLDVILFLYSEKYFKVTKFKEFSELLSWDRSRFNRLLENGWIENFRPGYKGRRAVYALSYKAKRMVASIYKKLEGEEIPMTACNNPMFAKKVRYTDKVYRNMIIQMNKEIKDSKLKEQEQRHVLE